MSSSDEENEILDLRKMEDVFACLEAVAMAQVVLSGVDPDTANELEKVTEALGALSLVIDQGDLVQVVEKKVEVPGEGGQAAAQPVAPPASGKKGIDDLVEFVGGGKPKGTHSMPRDKEEGIVDILTGEKVR
ncbi:MAG: hypothetical protein ABFS09_02885 [Thermodesulfobacteriota bacterium]